MAYDYDLVVIGSGPAGQRAAIAAAKLDKKVDDHIHKLSGKKGYDPLDYYAVMFEWTLPNGMLMRDAMVSQSPQIIQEKVNDLTSPDGVPPYWEAIPRPTRARAELLAWQWKIGY